MLVIASSFSCVPCHLIISFLLVYVRVTCIGFVLLYEYRCLLVVVFLVISSRARVGYNPLVYIRALVRMAYCVLNPWLLLLYRHHVASSVPSCFRCGALCMSLAVVPVIVSLDASLVRGQRWAN